MRSGNETIPAPQVAFGGNKTLAGLQAADKFCAAFAADDADLRKTPRQFRRRVDVGSERFDAIGQRRIVGHDAEIRPAHRRGRIGWRVEIVAERGAERLLVTLGDTDAVNDRRPQILGFAGDEFGDGLGFSLQPLHALVGFDDRRTRAVELGARGNMRGFAGLHGAGGLRERFLRGNRRLREGFEIGEAASLGVEPLDVVANIGDFPVDAGEAFRMGADVGLDLTTARGEIGERGGEFGEGALGGDKCGVGFRHPGVRPAAGFDARLDLFLEGLFLGAEPLDGNVGVGQLALFAHDVGGELRQAAIELGGTLLGQLLFAVEHVARVGEALQTGGSARFVLAQRGQLGSADRLNACGFGLVLNTLGLLAHGEVVGAAGFGDILVGLQPAQMKQQRLGLADLGLHFAIADGLPRLSLQAVDLARQLADHVLDAGEVGLGRLQAQLGLVAARMKSGDTSGVFQHAAALVGTGLNDFADLALVDEGG